jgi:hypothetical protein
MSVAEMKIEAVNHLLQLESEKTVQELLLHLQKLAQEEAAGRTSKMKEIFDKAKAQYGDVLQKLAE